MELGCCVSAIKESFHEVFSRERKTIRENLFLIVTSLMQSKNCQTPQIIRKMGKINGNNFKANENRLARFLDSSQFEVGERIWRAYIKFVLSLLSERDYLKEGSNICINVDFTTKTNEFLILSASIQFIGRSIPLYFSMRRYPIRKGMIDQVIMERAFVRELGRLVPRGDYEYTIVADRGFGNIRFMKSCIENGFNFVVRTTNNKNVEIGSWKGNMKALEKEDQDFKGVKLQSKKFEVRLSMSFTLEEEGWHVFSNLNEEAFEEVLGKYENRFQCEKMFQDEKSSGFEIEKSKITKYSRFKRLLFCVYVAQSIMMFLGDWINGEAKEIRKKYHHHINLISAFSKLQSVF